MVSAFYIIDNINELSMYDIEKYMGWIDASERITPQEYIVDKLDVVWQISQRAML